MRLLETRETESRVQGRQVVALQVLDESEERHLLIGDIELFVRRDGAEALGCRFILVLGICEQAPEGLEPAVTGDDLVPGADFADGDGLEEPMVEDARHQLSERALVHLGSRLVRWCGFWSRKLSAIRHVGGGAEGWVRAGIEEGT